MKAQNKIFTYLLAALMLVSAASAFASTNNNDSTETASTEEIISGDEIDDLLASLDEGYSNWLEDQITYNFYDADDNLVYTASTIRTESNDNPKLAKFLGKSDLLMEYEDTYYYRVNKVKADWVDVASL